MSEVQSHNNNGLFRKNKSRKRHRRLFIRRSKIYHSLTNNSLIQPSNHFAINYRPQTAQLRHRHIRRKVLNGAGDNKITPSPSREPKQIDFTELEHLFDDAIRNHLPVELYKDKPPAKSFVLTEPEGLHARSVPKLSSLPNDTRIEFFSSKSLPNKPRSPIHYLREHKMLAAMILISFSALIGFFSVFLFVQYH